MFSFQDLAYDSGEGESEELDDDEAGVEDGDVAATGRGGVVNYDTGDPSGTGDMGVNAPYGVVGESSSNFDVYGADPLVMEGPLDGLGIGEDEDE